MHAQAVIAIIGNFNRVSWKYELAGYRYMGLDAGKCLWADVSSWSKHEHH